MIFRLNILFVHNKLSVCRGRKRRREGERVIQISVLSSQLFLILPTIFVNIESNKGKYFHIQIISVSLTRSFSLTFNLEPLFLVWLENRCLLLIVQPALRFRNKQSFGGRRRMISCWGEKEGRHQQEISSRSTASRPHTRCLYFFLLFWAEEKKKGSKNNTLGWMWRRRRKISDATRQATAHSCCCPPNFFWFLFICDLLSVGLFCFFVLPNMRRCYLGWDCYRFGGGKRRGDRDRSLTWNGTFLG